MDKDDAWDVLVVGGGVTGVAAGIAAARSGARTLLLEARPFVGGNAATGLCLHTFVTADGRQVVYGLAQEFVDRLTVAGGAVGHVPYHGYVHSVTPVDGDLFRIFSTELLDQAGATVMYGATVIGLDATDGHVDAVRVATKGGVQAVAASTIVDSSGDADVAVSAGAGYRKGRAPSGKMQPVTMMLTCHRTDNAAIAEAIAVTPPAMAKRPDHAHAIPVYFNGTLARWNDRLQSEGLFSNDDPQVWFNTVWPDQINVNTSLLTGVDGTDARALSRATVALTRQVARIGAFLKEDVPGFERSHAVPAAFVGVRETRNINGLYEISDDDVRQGRKFEDTIGQCCFPADVHDPDTGEATHFPIGGDGAFDIPYRALVPRDLDNVLVAGRCVSATPFAHGATRNMVPCLVMGEAAGAAAALASAESVGTSEVDVGTLQDRLVGCGVDLGEHARAGRLGRHLSADG